MSQRNLQVQENVLRAHQRTCDAPEDHQYNPCRFKGQSCLVYIKDIIVFSSTFEEHIRHLADILRALRAAGLPFNLNM